MASSVAVSRILTIDELVEAFKHMYQQAAAERNVRIYPDLAIDMENPKWSHKSATDIRPFMYSIADGETRLHRFGYTTRISDAPTANDFEHIRSFFEQCFKSKVGADSDAVAVATSPLNVEVHPVPYMEGFDPLSYKAMKYVVLSGFVELEFFPIGY